MRNTYTKAELAYPNPSVRALGRLAAELEVRTDAAESARSPLHDRWDVGQAMYDGEAWSSGVQMIREIEPRIIQLVKPRVNTTRDDLKRILLSPRPVCQALTSNREQSRAEFLEKGMGQLMNAAKLAKPWRTGVQYACVTGQSFLHPIMGGGGRLKIGVVHSREMLASPVFGTDIPDMDMIGHQFYRPRWEIAALQKAKYYCSEEHFDAWTLVEEGGARRETISSAANPSSTYTSGGLSPLDSVRLFRLVVRIEVEGEMRPYVVTYAPESVTVLRCAEWNLSRPDYVAVRLHDEHNSFWYGTSLAWDLQGLQHLYTDLHNLLVYGSMVSALPPIFLSGGLQQREIESYGIAELIEVDAEVKATALPIRFDGRAIPGLVQQLERVTDAITGQSQNARGMPVKGGSQTLGEAQILQQYQTANTNALAEVAAESLEDLWGLVQEMARKFTALLYKGYGRLIAPEFWDVVDQEVDWDAVGRDTGKSPQALAAKFAMYRDMADHADSEIFVPDLEKKIIEADDLPFQPEDILGKSEKIVELARKRALAAGGVAGAVGGAVQEPGMGGGAVLSA